jgi:hypothetical protein
MTKKRDRDTLELGELGKVHEGVRAAFRFYGESVRVHPALSDLAFIDFMDEAGQLEIPEDLDAEDMTPEQRTQILNANTSVKRFLRQVIHPEDFERFWVTARAHAATMADLMVLAQTVVSGVAGRPTQSRSGSSPGREPTPLESGAGSSSAVVRRLESAGRPDLAVIVSMAEEHKAGSRSATG